MRASEKHGPREVGEGTLDLRRLLTGSAGEPDRTNPFIFELDLHK
jgi:hypothetical protein